MTAVHPEGIDAGTLSQEGVLFLFAPGLRPHQGQVDRRFLLPLPQDLQLGASQLLNPLDLGWTLAAATAAEGLELLEDGLAALQPAFGGLG